MFFFFTVKEETQITTTQIENVNVTANVLKLIDVKFVLGIKHSKYY